MISSLNEDPSQGSAARGRTRPAKQKSSGPQPLYKL